MLRYWIWLATRKYLSNDKKLAALEQFGSPKAIYSAKESELEVLALKKREVDSLMDKSLYESDGILRKCDDKGVHLLTWDDSAYPTRLKAIKNPPLVLYYDGRLPDFERSVAIGMVGTRKASLYGVQHAKELGYQIGKGGAIIVSGIAEGIDAASVEGALLSGAPVVCVLGNGIDVVYPKCNRRLYEEVRRNGCLITEFPPGTRPLPANFPFRNRIISGLSLGIVVVEAPKKSGALITAEQALEQGRDLYVVPANLGVASYKGNFKLLKENAALVEDGTDVLVNYVGRYDVDLRHFPVNFSAAQPVQSEDTVREETSTRVDTKTVDRKISENYIDISDILPKVSAEGAAVLKALCHGECHVDEIVETAGLPASKVSSAITVLEIKKFVKRLPGQRFSLAENIKVGERHE